jgi:cold shock CspA family protein
MDRVERLVGEVQRWNKESGFGFLRTITKTGLHKAWFLHASAIKSGEPEPGAVAIFTPGIQISAHRAPPALDVEILPSRVGDARSAHTLETETPILAEKVAEILAVRS